MNISPGGSASWRSSKDFLMTVGENIGKSQKKNFGRSLTKRYLKTRSEPRISQPQKTGLSGLYGVNDEDREIEVLGCSGAEFPGHRPPSFLLSDKILFDILSLTHILDIEGQWEIKHIFITHSHLDHIKGLRLLKDGQTIQI